jgi:phosphoadenosine phosphosulfate reductase
MRKGSIDEYGTHPPKMEWMRDFMELKEDFEDKCTYNKPMVKMFKKFLRDSEIVSINNCFEPMAELLFSHGVENEIVWALMLCNLAYAPQVGWLIDNLEFDVSYKQNEIKDMLSSFMTSKTGPGSVANSYRKMSELPLRNVGFGSVISNGNDGFEFVRTPWMNPEPRVILYSLFKFAEACGDYHQFTLSRLLNHEIESDGVSPTQIFGVDREQMEKILNGLSINYPEFINVSFTHDLDNITLRSDKISKDVLTLF